MSYLEIDLEKNTCSNKYITGISFARYGGELCIHLYCKTGHEQALYDELPLGIAYFGTIAQGRGQVIISLEKTIKV